MTNKGLGTLMSVLLLGFCLAAPTTGWAGQTLVAPNTLAVVNLPEDAGGRQIGEKITFTIRKWYCARYNKSFDLLKDIRGTLQYKLKRLLILAHRIRRNPKNKSYSREFKWLDRKIRRSTWIDAYVPSIQKLNIVLVAIPEAGGTNWVKKEKCFTNMELIRSWKKIRLWYFRETDRIINN